MSADGTSRAGKAARDGLPLSVMRMRGLELAAPMLGGQQRLADALCIEPRSLRAKLTAERGISDADLLAAAVALEERAAGLTRHASLLRAEAGTPPCTAKTSTKGTSE